MKSVFSAALEHNEPYLTQVLAIVLNKSKEYCYFFSREILHLSEMGRPIKVEAEVSEGHDRPDLVFYFKDGSIAVELKIDANFGKAQIERYKSKFFKVFAIINNLKNVEEAKKAENVLSWFQVYEITKKYLENSETTQDNNWCVAEFLKYLAEEGLTVDKVMWEVVNGSKAFLNLMKQIRASIKKLELDGTIKKTKEIQGTELYRGWRITGIPEIRLYLYMDPLHLFVTPYIAGGTQKGVEGLKKFSDVYPELGWGPKYLYIDDYKFGETTYLCLDAEKQVEEITSFLRKSIKRISK
jgi:hypothetical protein